jgi:hypothetical protein
MRWSTTWIAVMSESPNSSEKARSAEDAKAQKRAEIERKVAEARAQQQKEKELKAKAELEYQKLEQEKEARKQTQVRELVQEAMREKDEQLARNIAKREEENRALLLELQQNPLQKIMEFKVYLQFSHILHRHSIDFAVGRRHCALQGARVRAGHQVLQNI